MRTVLLLAVLSVLIAVPVSAAHYHLKADGTGDYATIQAAVNAATSGDTIICADGTYTGAGNDGIDFGGKNLILKSENNQPKNCVIDCSLDRGFYFHSGETASSIVQGFTIEGGGDTNGGGICIENSSPVIFNCVIHSCQASGSGGGIYVTGASANPSILNCLIIQNEALGDGGGIRFYYSNGEARNCSMVYNTGDEGGGVSFQGADADVVNCIIWGNSPVQIGNASFGLFSYNLVAGWTGGGTSFDGTPHFLTGSGGAYYLDQASSDAVDAGSALATAVCYTTADGSVCMSGGWTTKTNQQDDLGQVDVGYHYPHYAANIDVPSYKATIQAAIDAAWNGDVVRVADGTYTGDGNRDLDTKGKRITVQSLSGNASACIIDCQGSSGSLHRGFYIRKGEGPQTIIKNLKIINGWTTYGGGINVSGCTPSIQGCILSGNHATIDGGGIMNSGGNIAVTGCSFLSNTADDAGGGMLNHTCSPVLTSCVFDANSGYYGGGGLHNYQASPTLISCAFRYNIAPNGGGGGLHNDGTSSAPQLTGCSFLENQAKNGGGMFDRNGAHPALSGCEFLVNTTLASGRGGAIYGEVGDLSLTGCTFSGNEAYIDGGAIYHTGELGNVYIEYCLFDRNITSSGGGAVYFYNQEYSYLANCTFYLNESPNGGAIWYWLNCSAEIENCIFWDNRATTAGSQIGINNNCGLWVNCCDVNYGQSGVYVGTGSVLNWGPNNIDADPLFCDAAGRDFTIYNTSPCAPENSGGCGLIGALPVGCTATDVAEAPPATNRLHQSYPNPFNPTTKIVFDMKAKGPVSLKIFDVSGRLTRTLVNGTLDAGRHEIIWDGKDESGKKLASGAYFCRMTAGTFAESQKLVLIR